MSHEHDCLARLHGCSRRHRSYRAFARCSWPDLYWLEGTGPYASVSYC
jgi:hypothetical protein